MQIYAFECQNLKEEKKTNGRKTKEGIGEKNPILLVAILQKRPKDARIKPQNPKLVYSLVFQ